MERFFKSLLQLIIIIFSVCTIWFFPKSVFADEQSTLPNDSESAEAGLQQDTVQLPIAGAASTFGTLTLSELKLCFEEIKEQLKLQGYDVKKEQEVDKALNKKGVEGKPTRFQLKEAGVSIGADLIIISNIHETVSKEHFLDMAAMNVKTGSIRLLTVKLPFRGEIPYRSEAFIPATAVVVANLLGKSPDPMHAPFPEIYMANPERLIKSEAFEPLPVIQKLPEVHEEPEEIEIEDEFTVSDLDDAPKKKKDWKKWDHSGMFGELGFMFSWCMREGICESAKKGYGGRIRLGVRIASYVSLSFTAVAFDHQMPISTDVEVFLNADKAFVYAGVFGGLRIHPVRRFPVDPYIGIDFGHSWLLFAQNTEGLDGSMFDIPEEYQETISTLSKRREIVSLKGFTVTPEIGVNFFAAPSVAFGVHVQWLLPFWKYACSRVYDPIRQSLKSTSKVCSELGQINALPAADENADASSAAKTMDEKTRTLLSDKNNLPRFISLELDITFVFK